MLKSTKSKFEYTLWVIIAILIGIFLAMIATRSAGYQKIDTTSIGTPTNTIPEQTETTKKPTDPTQKFYFIKNPDKKPEVRAEAYFVGDLDTGEVILEKGKDQKFPIASVSKLFTATVSSDNQNQDDMTKVSARALSTLGQNGDLSLNEKIKVGDLVYPLLLESSNDAAEVIAEASGRDTFIKEMNEKVKELGLSATSFADPSGLSALNQSTAADLFKFSEYLKKNKTDLLKISTIKSFKNKKHTWYSNSQFLGTDGYLGGKRGYTDKARQTALSLFSIPLGNAESRNIGIVVLRSPDRFKDVQNILGFLKKNVYYGLESDASLAWVKQKDIIPEEENNFVTLAFGGDIMLDRGVKSSVIKNFNGDYSVMFDNLSLFKKADITFANLEGPASNQGKDIHNLYSFRMDPSVIPALKGAGISVLSVANNHEGDWGRDAYTDTLNRLNENEISYTGGGLNKAEAEQPIIIEKNNLKIGYLAFSDVGPTGMGATDTNAGILLTNNPYFDTIIRNASKQVDYLVVSFHFGDEYQTKHNARQEFLAHRAIDDGAKIIVGSHPHVIEDTEVYKNSFIAYSLGNLIFDQKFSPETMQGMILQIKLFKDGSMTKEQDISKLNSVFQPDTIIKGKEEKVKFETVNKL